MITVFCYGWEIYVLLLVYYISVVYQLICLSSADLIVIKQLISSDSELLSDWLTLISRTYQMLINNIT